MNSKTAKKLLSNINFSQTRNIARNKLGQNLAIQEIELSSDDLIQKFINQNGKCYWSGISLNESYNYISRHPLAISVDRLDNKIGYVNSNVVLTLRLFNLGKGSYSGDFSTIINQIKLEW